MKEKLRGQDATVLKLYWENFQFDFDVLIDTVSHLISKTHHHFTIIKFPDFLILTNQRSFEDKFTKIDISITIILQTSNKRQLQTQEEQTNSHQESCPAPVQISLVSHLHAQSSHYVCCPAASSLLHWFSESDADGSHRRGSTHRLVTRAIVTMATW